MGVYTPQTWANGAAGGTPLSAARLAHMEAGIEALDVALEAFGGTDLTESVQDIVAAFLVEGANVDVTYDDVGNTLTIAVTGLTEAVQDVVGALGFGGPGLSAVYDDTANTLVLTVNVDDSSIEISSDTLRVKAGGITNAMLAGGITLAKLASDPLARGNHTGTQTLATISDAGTAAAKDSGTGAGQLPTTAQADARYQGIGTSVQYPEHGTTLGETTIVDSDLEDDFDCKWGIDENGEVYWDSDGATPGEEAVRSIDPFNGAMSWIRVDEISAAEPETESRTGAQAKADAAEAAATAVSVHLTGDQSIDGVKTFTSDPIVPDEAYDATTWNGSLEPPTKNAVRDKIESLVPGLTTEQVQDLVGAFIQDSAVTDVTYDDAGNALTITLLPGAVTNAMLAGSIAYSKLNLTGSVALADQADVAQARVRGRKSGAGTGPPQDMTAAETVAVLAGAIGFTTTTVKTAAEIVNNSSTEQNDDELLFAIGASEIWVARFVLFVESGATGATADFKAGLSVPSGASVLKGVIGPATSVTTATATSTANRTTALATAQSVGALDSLIVTVYVDAYIVNGATPGTVALTWAQSTATAIDTTVRAGSFMQRTRVA